MGQGSAKNLAAISGVTITGTPSTGQVLTATSANAADWQTAGGGGGGTVFVFRPGGSASGNVYTTESDLEAAIATTNGPITIFFDCSLVSFSYTFTTVGNLNLGQYSTWTDEFTAGGIIFANGTTLSYPPINIAGSLYVGITQSETVYTSGSLEVNINLYDYTNINSSSGFFIDASASNCQPAMFGECTIGSSGSYVISGATYFLAYDRSEIGPAASNNVQQIFIYGPSVFIDPSFYSKLYVYNLYVDVENQAIANVPPNNGNGYIFQNGVLYYSNGDTWVPVNPPLPSTFAPSGTAAYNIFTNESDLSNYIGGVSGPQTMYLDFSAVAGSYTAAAALNLGSFIYGLQNSVSTQFPSLNTAFQINTPLEIHGLNIVSSSGPTFVTQPAYLSLYGSSGLQSSDGTYFFNCTQGAYIDMYGSSVLGNGSQPVVNVEAGGSLTITLYDFASVDYNAFTISGGTVQIIVQSPSSYVDPSYIGGSISGITVYFNYVSNTNPGSIQTGLCTLSSGTVTQLANINSSSTVVMLTLQVPSGTPLANQYAVTATTMGGYGTGNFTVTAIDATGATVTTDNSTLYYTVIG